MKSFDLLKMVVEVKMSCENINFLCKTAKLLSVMPH